MGRCTRVPQGQRAARIEMLLAHEFHARKFMLPDKLSFRDRERLQRAAGGEEDEDAPAAGGAWLPKNRALGFGFRILPCSIHILACHVTVHLRSWLLATRRHHRLRMPLSSS